MKLDLKAQREGFVGMGFEDKRKTVSTLLEGIRQTDQLFEDLYVLITSDHAIEQDFYDVFDSLMIVLYREEKVEESSALERLGDVRNRLQAQKEQEEADMMQGQKEAESLLVEMA